MTDDLRDRLTTAMMGAMGCQRWYSRPECELHGRQSAEPSGWPCPTAAIAAERLLPFIRDEIADALDGMALRWQFKDWADLPKTGDTVQRYIGSGQYVTTWLRARAEEARR